MDASGEARGEKRRDGVRRAWATGLGVGLALVGCGGGAATAPATMMETTTDDADVPSTLDGSSPDAATGVVVPGNLYPLSVGASWTYQISNPAGMMANKTTTVEAMEPWDSMGGAVAFRVRNEALGSATVNWEQLVDGVVVRYKQQMLDAMDALILVKTYAPSAVVVDESPAHLVAAATWGETYIETKPGASGTPKASQEFVKWTVEAVDDQVTVPAGTFTCVRVRRHHTSSNNSDDEVAWYAPGKGRIKETGGGPANDQTRELVSTTLP